MSQEPDHEPAPPKDADGGAALANRGLKQTTLQSPLRYPGGKRRLAAYIAEVLRTHKLRPKLFVEAFAGGASPMTHDTASGFSRNWRGRIGRFLQPMVSSVGLSGGVRD